MERDCKNLEFGREVNMAVVCNIQNLKRVKNVL
jgi:hypothetical protein